MSVGCYAPIFSLDFAIEFCECLSPIIARAGSDAARHVGPLCRPDMGLAQNSVASRLAPIRDLQYESSKSSSDADSGSEKPAT